MGDTVGCEVDAGLAVDEEGEFAGDDDLVVALECERAGEMAQFAAAAAP